jgi:hypothetical protein
MLNEWLEQRRREDLAARKAAQEANRDPETEQAVVAYLAHRANGGGMRWADFRREWFLDKGKEVDFGR